MEMDFLGPRSSPWTAMPLVAPPRRDDDQQPWRFAAPMLHTPDVVPAARRHPTAPSSEVHHVGARVPPSPYPQAFPCGIPASYLQGSQVGVVHNAAHNRNQRCPAAQLTIFYAGSVHVFDNVTKEKAEQIMFMASKAAQAQAGGGSLLFRLPLRQSESAPVPDERQMAPLARACSDPMHLNPDAVHGVVDNTSRQALFMLPPRDVPLARSASLARFLERRKQKQRAANATTPYSRRDISPGSTDTFLMVSPGNTALSGNTELAWFFGDEKEAAATTRRWTPSLRCSTQRQATGSAHNNTQHEPELWIRSGWIVELLDDDRSFC